jgi:hypothetical protein
MGGKHWIVATASVVAGSFALAGSPSFAAEERDWLAELPGEPAVALRLASLVPLAGEFAATPLGAEMAELGTGIEAPIRALRDAIIRSFAESEAEFAAYGFAAPLLRILLSGDRELRIGAYPRKDEPHPLWLVHAEVAADREAILAAFATWRVDASALGLEVSAANDAPERITISTTSGVRAECRLIEDTLEIAIAPDGVADATALAALLAAPREAPMDSVVASVLATLASDGGSPWIELLVDLRRLRATALERQPPPEALTSFLPITGPRYDVMAFRSSIHDEGIRDSLAVREAVGDQHLLRLATFFDSSAFDSSFARFDVLGGPAEATRLHIGFDATRSIAAIRAAREDDDGDEGIDEWIDEWIASISEAMAIDVENDVLAAIGDDLLFALRGDYQSALEDDEPFEFVFALGLRDAAKFRSFVEGLRERNLLPLVPRKTGGAEFFGLTIPFVAMPDGVEPCLAIEETVLLVASSPPILARARERAAPSDAPQIERDGTILAFEMPSAGNLPGVEGILAELSYAIDAPFDAWLDAAAASLEEAADRAIHRDDPSSRPRDRIAVRAVGETFVLDIAGPAGILGVAARGIEDLELEPRLENEPKRGEGTLEALRSSRSESLERAAQSTLRALASAQSLARLHGHCDRDGDGHGEFLALAELTGIVPPPDAEEVLGDSAIGGDFGFQGGVVATGNYVFRIFLPGVGGAPLPELDDGGSPKGVDADLAEQHFAIYAWPLDAERGGRPLFVGPDREVYVLDVATSPWIGLSQSPPGDAAFAREGDITQFEVRFGVRTGPRGERWVTR